MKKALILICLAALLPAAASAEIVGEWSPATVSGDYSIYTLNVSATAGETMWGFDLMVESAAPDFRYSSGMSGKDVIAPTAGLPFTYFILDGGAVNDTIADVDTTYLKGAFAAKGDGIYSSGWTDLNLLQVAVLTTSGATPADWNVCDATSGDLSGLAAIGSNPSMPSFASIRIVPEPGTLALLACGLFGLAIYVWRKRR